MLFGLFYLYLVLTPLSYYNCLRPYFNQIKKNLKTRKIVLVMFQRVAFSYTEHEYYVLKK